MKEERPHKGGAHNFGWQAASSVHEDLAAELEALLRLELVRDVLDVVLLGSPEWLTGSVVRPLAQVVHQAADWLDRAQAQRGTA